MKVFKEMFWNAIHFVKTPRNIEYLPNSKIKTTKNLGYSHTKKLQ